MSTDQTNKSSKQSLCTGRLRKIILFLCIFSIVFSGNAQTTLKERLEQHIYTLASDSLQGREAGTIYAKMASDYIVKQFEEIGIEPYFGTSIVQTFGNNALRNVVGVIRGNDAALENEYIVVGAHYDHLGFKNGKIYNGADDNASGVATLIELARKLKDEQASLKRSVIIAAFDAEELGLFGSIYLANHPEAQIENIKLMISVDMVGWYKTSGEVIYSGSGTIKGGKEMIENQQLVPAGLNVAVKKFETGFSTATDTQPFAVKGIPTLHLSTGLKSLYHKPEDEAHLIDYDGMVLITEHLKNIVADISQDIDYKSSGKLAKKHRPQPRVEFGLLATIGSNYHHYTQGAVDGKTAASFGAGLMSQVNFRHFAIRPEVHYERVRAKYPAGLIATDNLTVPVSLVLQKNITDYINMGVDLSFGGYYSYRFGGKQGKEIIDFDTSFNRHEGGIAFGFGIYLQSFKIGYTCRRALTDFTQFPNADNAHIRNRMNYFTIMYRF